MAIEWVVKTERDLAELIRESKIYFGVGRDDGRRQVG